MLGGEWFEEIFGNAGEVSEEDVGKVAVEELQAHLGIKKEPIDMLVKIQKVGVFKCQYCNRELS